MRALTELKKECFRRISNNTECLCGNFNPKQLLIHHLSYTSKSITYNKFENSDDGRLKYYANLLDEIKQDPSNFLVLCFNCHKKLEELLKLSYEQVLKFMQNNNVYFLLLAYNLTCEKRGMKIIENPEDVIFIPEFLKKFLETVSFSNEGDLYDCEEWDVTIRSIIKSVSDKIQSKQFSLNEFAQSAILSEELSYYILPYPHHIIAAKQLESITTIKKGDKILYVFSP